jgi:hypothetical protein
MKRFAIFAVLGAILSSAVLVGCGGGGDEAATDNTAAPKDKAKTDGGE